VIRLCLFAGLVFVAVGCSNSDSPEQQQLVGGERLVEAPLLTETIGVLTDEFHEAEASFAACMANEGFSYEQRAIEVSVTTDDGGLLTVSESRREYGYGIVGGEGSAGVQVDIRGGEVPEAQAEAFELLMRDGSHRCVGLLYTVDIQQHLADLRLDFDADLVSRVTSDRRYLSSQGAWASCMGEAGYSFGSSAEIFDNIESRFVALDTASADYERDRDTLRTAELAVASQDLDCYLKHIEPAVDELLDELSEPQG